MSYAFISGATGGLGGAFARKLVLTDDLFLTGRSEEKLLALKSELLAVNPAAKIEIFAADLTDEAERRAAGYSKGLFALHAGKTHVSVARKRRSDAFRYAVRSRPQGGEP